MICQPSIKNKQSAAMEIVRKGGQIKEGVDHTYKVKSQSGNRYYEVTSNPEGITCTCPDFVKHRTECKHILAVKYYLENQGNVTITEQPRKTYPQDWKAYNTAQTDEIKFFDTLLKNLIQTIPEPEQTMGRPRLPIQDSLYCAVQKVYSQKSSRRSQGLIEYAVERKQIEHAPHFNTASKLFNDSNITPILHKLVGLTALPVAKLDMDFAIDSTGFSTTRFNSYNGSKYGQNKAHSWIKAHMAIGIKTNIVAAIKITPENGADSPQFKPLLDDIFMNFDIREISADLAYSSHDNLDAVSQIGGVPYIPFKKNITGRAGGSSVWKKTYHYFQLNRDEFMMHYHKRSNAEATNAAIKAKLGETLRSKNQVAQINELLAKVIAYNITVVIHEMFENGISPDFLHERSDGLTQSTMAMVGLAVN